MNHSDRIIADFLNIMESLDLYSHVNIQIEKHTFISYPLALHFKLFRAKSPTKVADTIVAFLSLLGGVAVAVAGVGGPLAVAVADVAVVVSVAAAPGRPAIHVQGC